MKNDPVCISEPVFRSAVSVYANIPFEKMVENIKHHRSDADINPEDGDGSKGYHTVIKADGLNLRILWLESFDYQNLETLGILGHEVDHLVTKILRDSGVETRRETDEVHAYLGEFYFCAIAGALRKKRKH